MKKNLLLTCFFFANVFALSYAQNLQLVKEINTAPGAGSNPYNFTISNNKLFFIAYDNTNYNQLWVTSGTDASTQRLGPSVGVANSISNLAAYNNKVFFAYDDGINGTELWTSDGTAAGTVLFKDINPGVAASFPEALIVNNGKLFFDAVGSNGLYNLYVTDGTAAGTSLIRNGILLVGGHGGVHPKLGNYIYFDSDNGTGTGNGLWKTDGTTTVLVKADIIASEVPGMYATLNNKLYLNVSDYTYGSELWISDGTTSGTHLLKNLSADGGGVLGNGNPQGMTVYNNKVYFAGRDDTHGMELFVTDGTEPGTVLVKDILPGIDGSLPYNSTVFNGFLYITCWGTQELWQSDGTEAGTILVKALPYYSRFAATWNNKMYLVNGISYDLWQSDGTAAGTIPATAQNTIYPISSTNGYPSDFYFTEYNSELYFAGYCYLISDGFEPVKLTLAVLPLKLLSFTGDVDKDKDLLKWTTANEINTSYFKVEQSINGTVFKQAATISAKGLNTTNTVYSFTQQSSLNPAGYYRLQIFDKDGAFTYSPIIKLKHANTGNISAAYNAGNKQITIINNTQANYHWQLVSINGGFIKQGTATPGIITLPASGLAAGIYMLVCTSASAAEKIKLEVF